MDDPPIAYGMYKSMTTGPSQHDEDDTDLVGERRTTAELVPRDVLSLVNPPPDLGALQKPIFVDAKQMQEKLRSNLHVPRYDVANFYHTEGFCQSVARSAIFENVTLGVISFNALWISIDTDLNTAEVLYQADPLFIVAENLFCLFFTLELTVRFGAFEAKTKCLRDGWFMFDLGMVLMMIFETWVMTGMLLFFAGGSGSTPDTRLLRLFRLFRLSRVSRLVRLLHAMPELLILIKGMLASVRSVFFTMLLLMLVLYVFSILYRQLTNNTELGDEFFPTIAATAASLIVYGFMYDGAGYMQHRFIESKQQILLAFYFAFVLLVTLTLMNMLIGILCDVIIATADVEHEELTICAFREVLQQIVDEVCVVDGDGELRVHKADFLCILQHPDASHLLNSVRVNVFSVVDLVDTLFAKETGGERHLSFSDLVDVLVDQRASVECTVQSLTQSRKYLSTRLDKVEKEHNAACFSLGNLLEQVCNLPAGEYAREVESVYKELKAEQERMNPSASMTLRQEAEENIADQQETELQRNTKKNSQTKR